MRIDNSTTQDTAETAEASDNHQAHIRLFLDQKRKAFKTTLEHLAGYGVTIRSFTELHEHVVDVENRLPIMQQLIIQAYRHALLVSTVEALFKQATASETTGSIIEAADPRREERQ